MQIQIDFRCAYLNYLLAPSCDHKKELIAACNALYDFAGQNAKTNYTEVGADEVGIEVAQLVQEAINDLCITEKQLKEIREFQDKMVQENKVKAIKFDTVLTAAAANFTESKRVVSAEHYKAFSSIYPIILDGHRIIKKDKIAGKATIKLADTLMQITLDVCNKNELTEQDKLKYNEAYTSAKNAGIENHRGLKEKFHNFCIALTCVLIFPIFMYASQDSFWSTTKTKTQNDIENCENTLAQFQP